jgi:hypothetical protein
MASARFQEMLRCNGVDQQLSPHPGMIVPFGGENQVVLDTFGMDVTVHSAKLTVHEYEGKELTTRMLSDIRDELSKADVDPQQRLAFMPDTTWRSPRFFRVLGTVKTGFPGTFVDVVPKATPGRVISRLQVAVVDRQVVKVAIRHVRARDAHGHLRLHGKRPGDATSIVAQMNFVWRPQTNIVFELVDSSDVVVDHNDPNTRRELTAAYGMKSAATFVAESTVWADKNSGWFARHKVPGTHITFFLVHQIHSGGDPVYGKGGIIANGTMNRPSGVSFISDSRLPSTFAHEAGHFIGDMAHEGIDHALLMRGEGSGYRIPFQLAKRFKELLATRSAGWHG